MFFIFGMLQLFHLNIFSLPSRGSGHGLGLQKCEARAVGPRKPCGGFIELGLTGLGLGWPAASRPGRHITTNKLGHILGYLVPGDRSHSVCLCKEVAKGGKLVASASNLNLSSTAGSDI